MSKNIIAFPDEYCVLALTTTGSSPKYDTVTEIAVKKFRLKKEAPPEIKEEDATCQEDDSAVDAAETAPEDEAATPDEPDGDTCAENDTEPNEEELPPEDEPEECDDEDKVPAYDDAPLSPDDEEAPPEEEEAPAEDTESMLAEEEASEMTEPANTEPKQTKKEKKKKKKDKKNKKKQKDEPEPERECEFLYITLNEPAAFAGKSAELEEFIGADNVIVLNKKDISFLDALYAANGTDAPDISYVDLTAVSRKLNLTLKDSFLIGGKAKNGQKLANENCNFIDVCYTSLKKEVFNSFGDVNVFAARFKNKPPVGTRKAKDYKTDPESPVYRMHCCIPYKLPGWEGGDIRQVITNIGGIIDDEAGRTTDLLILPDEKYTERTNCEEAVKAAKLAKKGIRIEIIPESQLDEMLGLTS